MLARSLVSVLLAASSTLVTSLQVAAQSITSLGLPPGLPSTAFNNANAVSADGSVVTGWACCWPGSHAYAYRWTAAGGLQSLGAFPGGSDTYATAISADGALIAGYAYTSSAVRPVLWNGTYQNLGTLPGFQDASGWGMSADGSTVVGHCIGGVTGYERAFRWTLAGGMQDLGALPGLTRSWAVAASADGLVVTGWSGSAPYDTRRAFRWTGQNGMQDIGVLPSLSYSYAGSINSDGTVIVGTSGSPPRAFRWTITAGMQDLGTLAGAQASYADAVSADGSIVVGRSGNQVFFWTASLGMVDLGSYLVSRGVNLSGWTSLVNATSTTGISADGTAIIGGGQFNGNQRAWIVRDLWALHGYCTSSTTTNGCVASIAGTGTASASASSGFVVSVDSVEGQKQGMIFYGIDNSGWTPLPWASGSTSYLCVKQPVQRTPAHNSGGTLDQCDGVLSIDWNAFRASTPLAVGQPFTVGQHVYAQGWFRDPPAPKTTNLSDGLEFVVQP